MTYSSRFAGSANSTLRQAAIALLTAALLLVVPVAGNTQETTSSIQGAVTDAAGNPVGGASLSALHVPTGRSQSTTTNAAGTYRFAKLRVGGPYVVTLRGTSTYGEERIEEVFISLGSPYTLDLRTRTEAIEEIVVSASQQDMVYRVGAGSSFGTENILGMANVNRDFKNIVRQDPRVIIDPTNEDAVSIAGTNNRYNSLTVDGVRQNDDFGLNNSGFPTQRAPLSIDAIEQIVVEVSPFDVSYGGFTGGTINVVTKSGTNEWNGSLAMFNSNEDLVGDKSEDDTIDLGKFDQDTFAATLSGPIIKDRLWFFASYDEFTESDTSAVRFGPAGSGRPNEISGVTQSEVNDVIRIADQVYGFDAGTLPDSGIDVKDEKLLVKLDLALGDNHDVTFTYQDVTGNNIVPQGSFGNQLGLPSNWYDRSEAMETMALQVFSAWNDRLTTELKVSSKENNNGQISLNGTDFSQMTIDTPTGGAIRIGPDEFRHANKLDNEQMAFKFQADYLLGEHNIKVGLERDEVEIFNIFAPGSEGIYEFDSITDFENRVASSFEYENAFTNVKNDAGATFEYAVNSFYAQDEVDINDQLSIQYGVRYDWYEFDDSPRENAGFVARNGFSNTATLDGLDVLMPRFGFTYDFDNGVRVRGGVGKFSGGSPNVWVSNSFSNDGQTIVAPDNDGDFDPACEDVLSSPAALTNVDGYEIPAAVQACMFPGSGDVEATDPFFNIPSTWRFNLAAEREFDLGFLGDGWLITAEAVISEVQDAVEWKDLRRRQIDTAPDGRPIYDTPPTYDVILTNTSDGRSDTFTLSAAKSWDTNAGLFDLNMAYTYMDAEDVNPAQSSTVSSNYGRPATFDRNNRQLSVSDFEIEHRFNGTFGWQKNLFGDNLTRISGFFEIRSGKRFSYTMREGRRDTDVWGGDSTFARRDSQLLYVPLLNDPNVIFSNELYATVNDPAVEANFNNFVKQAGLEGYRGQIMPRNFDTTDGRARVDLRLQQEIGLATLPGVGETKIELFVDIENLGNLLNDDWGRVEQVFFPHNYVAVGEVSINSNGQYVYGPFNGSDFDGGIDPAGLFELPSLWKVQLGVKVSF